MQRGADCWELSFIRVAFDYNLTNPFPSLSSKNIKTIDSLMDIWEITLIDAALLFLKCWWRLVKLKIIGGVVSWRAVMCCCGWLYDYHSCLATVTKNFTSIGYPKAAAAALLKSHFRSSTMPVKARRPAGGTVTARKRNPWKLSPPPPHMMTMVNLPLWPSSTTLLIRGKGPRASTTVRPAWAGGR